MLYKKITYISKMKQIHLSDRPFVTKFLTSNIDFTGLSLDWIIYLINNGYSPSEILTKVLDKNIPGICKGIFNITWCIGTSICAIDKIPLSIMDIMFSNSNENIVVFMSSIENNVVVNGGETQIQDTQVSADITNSDTRAATNNNIPSNRQSTLNEIDRLFVQLNSFIDQFNHFVATHPLNIVVEYGLVGVDTNNSVTNDVAQNWARRIEILDDLIRHVHHLIEGLILTIIEPDIYNDLSDKLKVLHDKYRHWD